MTFSLVTGGAGFVGRRLVRTLKDRGERVRALDLAPLEGEDGVQGSVADPDAAARAVEGVDVVFHLAGHAQLWSRDPGLFDKANRAGTETMLAAAKRAGVKRFVHCSSLTTLVGRRAPRAPSTVDETTRLEPADMLGPYPRSKLRAERAVEQAVIDGLDAVIVIPTEPLGAGDKSLTPPTRMILDFLRGATPAYIDCTLNFVPVGDLAEGLIAARERGRRGERYILGGENVSMQTLLDALERVSGKPTPKTKLPYQVALAAGFVDTAFSYATGRSPKAPLTGVRLAGRPVSFSSEKAARELGWRAGGFEPALEEAYGWMKAEGLLG
ncbi:NAD-dependent epimerase/dehydratase family protein [Amphiplicatus metriothermophilus]|uniref:Dihydroflavonol-4-reductase n=1 Tax=Amphiplicatus metriothermophilus TaxID=1519374 RepID=A0A239PWL4_9PROT|nr:NAD-dependent epimerase/dehydratase family protein [Amphiplicatus metriothermophilus]MBB5519520.1 dihydroflavonol-4-reductase [Amphiplicatus metriothermophilus]SNT74087.1 dihydroflavonol-4-reductase [Amphiplicatus metriothermophilus]